MPAARAIQLVVATPRAGGGAVGYGPKQKQVRAYRGQIPSPGRPTVAWREDRVRFWAAIARGVKTEDACVEARVSGPVGFRWFRHAGGVNPCLPPVVSGRYLSFAVREDIALLCAQGAGVREIARRIGRSPSTISREWRRNASTRTYNLTTRRRLRSACRASSASSEGCQAGRQRPAASVRSGRLSGAVRNMADTDSRPGRAEMERQEQAASW
jgi:transposase-like protein